MAGCQPLQAYVSVPGSVRQSGLSESSEDTTIVFTLREYGLLEPSTRLERTGESSATVRSVGGGYYCLARAAPLNRELNSRAYGAPARQGAGRALRSVVRAPA